MMVLHSHLFNKTIVIKGKKRHIYSISLNFYVSIVYGYTLTCNYLDKGASKVQEPVLS